MNSIHLNRGDSKRINSNQSEKKNQSSRSKTGITDEQKTYLLAIQSDLCAEASPYQQKDQFKMIVNWIINGFPSDMPGVERPYMDYIIEVHNLITDDYCKFVTVNDHQLMDRIQAQFKAIVPVNRHHELISASDRKSSDRESKKNKHNRPLPRLNVPVLSASRSTDTVISIVSTKSSPITEDQLSRVKSILSNSKSWDSKLTSIKDIVTLSSNQIAPLNQLGAIHQQWKPVDVEMINGEPTKITLNGNSYMIKQGEKGTLGKGSFGIVFSATDSHGNPVAIKQINIDESRKNGPDSDYVKAVKSELSEIDALELVKASASCINVIDSGVNVELNKAYCIFPLYNQTLDAYVDTVQNRDELFFLKLADTLEASIADVHRAGLAHNDIKPKNIMVTDNGDPIIIDFGQTDNQIQPGSPVFMSPRQVDVVFQGGKSNKAEPNGMDRQSSDQWSLGVTLWNLAFGDYPYMSNEQQNNLNTLGVFNLIKTFDINTLKNHNNHNKMPNLVDRIYQLMSGYRSERNEAKGAEMS